MCASSILEMAPRARNNEPDIQQLRLANVPDKGLGYYDKESRLVMVSNVSLKLLGT